MWALDGVGYLVALFGWDRRGTSNEYISIYKPHQLVLPSPSYP